MKTPMWSPVHHFPDKFLCGLIVTASLFLLSGSEEASSTAATPLSPPTSTNGSTPTSTGDATTEDMTINVPGYTTVHYTTIPVPEPTEMTRAESSTTAATSQAPETTSTVNPDGTTHKLTSSSITSTPSTSVTVPGTTHPLISAGTTASPTFSSITSTPSTSVTVPGTTHQLISAGTMASPKTKETVPTSKPGEATSQSIVTTSTTKPDSILSVSRSTVTTLSTDTKTTSNPPSPHLYLHLICPLQSNQIKNSFKRIVIMWLKQDSYWGI
ncbi:cell wall protein DAN4-like [Dermochelys coriacea]|uniref:cell wall protein DAN4-like n=1 Tax=Dermochelys coriacea TaxID=27794 RepID=UPI001CAA39DF|nr:cell wall protein DAN4-like [Dermochelys coriacea]